MFGSIGGQLIIEVEIFVVRKVKLGMKENMVPFEKSLRSIVVPYKLFGNCFLENIGQYFIFLNFWTLFID